MMMRRDWFYGIGPFDENEAVEFRDKLRRDFAEPADVSLIDYREWYVSAWDVDSVRETVRVLEAGVAAPGLAIETKRVVLGIVDGLKDWLDRQYDPDFRGE